MCTRLSSLVVDSTYTGKLNSRHTAPMPEVCVGFPLYYYKQMKHVMLLGTKYFYGREENVQLRYHSQLDVP